MLYLVSLTHTMMGLNAVSGIINSKRHLALQMDPIALLPHFCLQTLSWKHWFNKAHLREGETERDREREREKEREREREGEKKRNIN